MIPDDDTWVVHKCAPSWNHFDFIFFCPGCQCCHGFNAFINREPRWIFNGDMHRPTLTPSLLIKGSGVCHSHIKDGMIQFLNDCTHGLAGQTVLLEPF